MQEQGVPYLRVKPGRYAARLRAASAASKAADYLLAFAPSAAREEDREAA